MLNIDFAPRPARHPADTSGLDDGSAASAEPRLLEADQGDAISGKVSRAEAATVVAAALASPDAANKTFELRRCVRCCGAAG